MRRILNPKTQKHVVLGGCRLPRHSVGLRLARYLVPKAVPRSPDGVAWNNAAAMQVIRDIEGNDQYGDCVEAEDAHYLALMTANGKGLFAMSDAQTLARYAALTGFNPADPSTDVGTDPIQDLNYALQNPYADGSVDAGYLLVDATNKDEVKYALATFGNLKIWLALPDAYVNPFPSGDGFVWGPGTPNPQQGHCIGGCGYVDAAVAVPQALSVLGISASGVAVMTWGLVGTLTWDGLATLCVDSAGGGLAVRVTQDWLNAGGKSPTGLDYASLVQDFDAIGGTVPPPPAPAPPAPPGPAPAPSAGPSLADAQAWASAGLAANWPAATKKG